MHIAFFPHTEANPIGSGGQHRAYQIFHDLQQIVGADSVRVFTYQDCVDNLLKKNPFYRRLQREYSVWEMRLGTFIDNPYRVLGRSGYAKRIMHGWLITGYYESYLRNNENPKLCILEGTKYFPILQLNKKYKIPTVICPQNLDSLNQRLSLSSRAQRAITLVDFNNELQVLQQAEKRLFVSKVETALIGGLGIPSLYYPYKPVGKLSEYLMTIRCERQESQPEKGSFLILGTVHNSASMEGLEWFLTHAKQHGLPSDIRIVIIGRKTKKFERALESLPNIKILDFVEQSVLDKYLTKVSGVLILNKTGFGAITRLSEMSYAGIPAITFPHPTFAVDNIEGLSVASTWEDWINAMQNIDVEVSPSSDNSSWIYHNSSVLSMTVKEYL